jgi:hypothetical protein
MHSLTLRWGLAQWYDVANERLYNRDLVRDAASMWMRVREIHALRTLDEFAQELMLTKLTKPLTH